MANSRVKGGRLLAIETGAALVIAVSLAVAAQAGTLGTLPVSQDPSVSGSQPPVPDSAGSSGVRGGTSGPQSIVPPGFGATAPASRMPESGNPSGGGIAFPGGQEPASGQSSVRTLQAVPGRANASITVGTLGGVDASSVGLIGEGSGGFGPGMWQGATRTDVERYLAQLPVASGSPVMNDLSDRLLLSSAQPPEGQGSGSSLLAVRLDRLIAAGRPDKAAELARSAMADKSAPVAMARARAALALGQTQDACMALADIPAGNDPAHDAADAFSTRLSAYCQVVSGNKRAASLTLDLAREEGLDDPLFYSLAAQAIDGLKLKADEPAALTALDVALHRLAGRELPKNAGEIAEPAVLAGLARDEALAAETRIAAGERAAMFGLVEGGELASLYKLAQFTPEEMEGLKTATFPASPALRRALIYQALQAEVSPLARADLFRLMLATGESSGLYLATVEVLRAELAQMTPSAVLRGLAPAAVRAFLFAGEREHALAWYELVAQEGRTIGRDARELGALMRISDPTGPAGNPDQVAADITSDLKSGVKATRDFGVREALLLDALGYRLPQPVLEALAASRKGAAAGSSEAMLNQLRAAGQKGAVGETVMLSLVAIGPGGPGEADPQAAAQAVSSLKALHLDDEARRLAVEALMGRSHAEPG